MKNDREPAVNIDYSSFNINNPLDYSKTALLARTKSEFSLAVINVSDAFLVAMFNQLVDPNSFIEKFNPKSIMVKTLDEMEEAFVFATYCVKSWFKDVGINDPNFQLSHVITDAKPNEPYISDDGKTRLSPDEELRRTQLLGRIVDVGARVPIVTIVSQIK